MSITEKIEEIRKGLQNYFNGNVTGRAALNDQHQVVFTVKLKYSNYNYSYLVVEEAIEMQSFEEIVAELIPIFETLIWESIRRR